MEEWRINNLCIVYEDNIPSFILNDEAEAFTYASVLIDRKAKYLFDVFKSDNMYVDRYVDINTIKKSINIFVSSIKYTFSGLCISYVNHYFNSTTNSFHAMTNPMTNTQNNMSYQNQQYQNIPYQNIPYQNQQYQNQQYQNNIPSYHNNHNHNHNNYNHNHNHNYNQQHNQKYNQQYKTDQQKPLSDPLINELTELSKVLDKANSKKITDIHELNELYKDIIEEAALDEMIRNEKEQADNTYKDNTYKDITTRSDNGGNNDSNIDRNIDSNTSDSHYDDNDNCDDDSDSYICSDSNGENDSTSSDDTSYIDITDDMTDDMKRMVEERNKIKKQLKIEQMIIDRANDKLNEELFLKRCEDQERRKEEQKRAQGISVLKSDKNVYLHIDSKIKSNKIKDSNIPPFFVTKYYIIKFMNDNDLIDMTNDEMIEAEYDLFTQLYKVVELYEASNDNIIDDNVANNNTKDDNSAFELTVDDLLTEIDNEYVDICVDFFDTLSSLGDNIMTEKKIHETLNNESKIDNELFKRVTT